MVKVNFILRKRGQTNVVKKGRVAYPVYPILMRVSFNGKRMELSTGLHACEIQWNKESQRVKLDVNGMMPKSYVNAGLEQLSGVVQLANSDSYRKGQILTDKKVSNAVATLRARLARTVKHNEGKESANATKHADECAKTKRRKYFEGAYQDFMRREGESKGWSKSTREKYNSMWNHVRKMERMKGNGFRLSFDFFREKGLAEYFHFLGESEGLKNTTVKKQLEFLRRFLRWAFKHKYHTIDDFKYFSPVIRIAQNEPICLTENELHQLQHFRVPVEKPSLFRVKDIFLFACYTGLRYSDIANLRYANVTDDHIAVIPRKTGKCIRIPLNDGSRAILKKYMRPDCKGADTIFPCPTLQKMNSHLKSLCRLAGITSEITLVSYHGENRIQETVSKCDKMTTHAGRRTFISLAIANGVPPQVVLKMTGKRTIKSLQVYIHIDEEPQEKAMDLLNKIFSDDSISQSDNKD